MEISVQRYAYSNSQEVAFTDENTVIKVSVSGTDKKSLIEELLSAAYELADSDLEFLDLASEVCGLDLVETED